MDEKSNRLHDEDKKKKELDTLKQKAQASLEMDQNIMQEQFQKTANETKEWIDHQRECTNKMMLSTGFNAQLPERILNNQRLIRDMSKVESEFDMKQLLIKYGKG